MYLLTIISILTSLLSPFSIAYYNTFARLYPFIVGMFGFFNRKNINDVISSKSNEVLAHHELFDSGCLYSAAFVYR